MRLILTTSLSLLAWTSLAQACFCVAPTECPRLGRKEHPVFVGTVLEITDLPAPADDISLSRRKVHIHVNESFGGLAPGAREVAIFTGAGPGDCGVPFKAGEVYLIKGFLGKDWRTHAAVCTHTQKLETAGAALRLLRQQRDGQPLPTLAGQIAELDRDFPSLFGRQPPKSLANVLIRAHDGTKEYEAMSDKEGYYAFYNLPSGHYQLALVLPPGLTFSDRPFELKTEACRDEDLEVVPSGSIQGRILDSSDKLLTGAFAYIVPAHQKVVLNKTQLYWASQTDRAFYEFVNIPPGEYVILVNPEDSQDPEFPFRRTFYPGVHDRAQATIINVSPGQEIKDVDMQLPQQFTPRNFTVRVTWIDGRLIRDNVSVRASVIANPKALDYTRQPESKASIVNLSIVPDEPYEVEAELICQYSNEHYLGPGATLRSNKLKIGPRDHRTQLTLTIPAMACPKMPAFSSHIQAQERRRSLPPVP